MSRPVARLSSILILLFTCLIFTGCRHVPALWGGAAAVGQMVITPVQQAVLPPPVVAASETRAAQPTLDLATASTNRLLVQGVDGNLFTVAPDGSGRFNLTTNAGRGWIYTQPTWSSTGERVAWTAIERTTDGSRSTLVTAQANGTQQTSTETLFPPLYLYWSPDDSKVAYLSNWISGGGPSIALRTVDVAGGGEAATTVDVGQPYYFSWAPDSRRLLAHVDNRQVRLLDISPADTETTEAAKPTVLVDGSANFAAPQWIGGREAAADQLLYVLDDENTAQLVLTDAAGESQEFLTYLSRQDFVSFNMNATGSHIAYIETTDMIGFNSFGPLFVYNLEEEFFEQLSTAPAIAFFWSPDGSALLFLTVELALERPWLRVNVWDGEEVRRYERFIPSAGFLRDYLRFADQYMQSMRFWAPDGSAVVYTGQAEDGSAGVWVQPVSGDSPADLVVAGTFATWSPR